MRIESQEGKRRRRAQQEKIKDVIVFYESRGFDWSLIVEFLVREMNESLPRDERRPWQKKCPSI